MLADFFDTMGTMTAIGAEAGLLDEEGTPPNTQRILVVDSIAAAAGGAAGVSSNTSYIESASGVGEGARTGLASVVTGLLFLLTIFFAPLVAIIPSEAAVPALVLVGLPDDAAGQGHRLGRRRDRDPGVPDDRADAVHLLDHRRHRRRLPGLRPDQARPAARPPQIHPLLWVVAALFVVYFAIDPITAWSPDRRSRDASRAAETRESAHARHAGRDHELAATIATRAIATAAE